MNQSAYVSDCRLCHQGLTNCSIANKGVALLSVLLMLVLLSTLAIYNMEKQDLFIRKVSNQRTAEQAFQIATGGEQWAVKLLEQDILVDNEAINPDFDHTNEPWANLGPAVKVEGTESLMQVVIYDEQGKFNLNNLIQGKVIISDENQNQNESESGGFGEDGAEGENQNEDSDDSEASENSEENADSEENNQAENKAIPNWYNLFQRILLSAGLEPNLVDVVVDWVDENDETTGTSGAEDLFYTSLESGYRAANQQLTSLSELRYLRGFSTQVINALSPFVTALPVSSRSEYVPINVNTASAKLLATLSEDTELSEEAVLPLLEVRAVEPFQSTEEFRNTFVSSTLTNLSAGVLAMIDVKSSFFISRSCAQSGDVKLSQLSLLEKNREKEVVTVHYRRSNYSCPDINSTNY